MALTVAYKKLIRWADAPLITETKLSTLTAGLEEDAEHGGPAGARPFNVTCSVITPPTDGSDVKFAWLQADDDTTNDEVRVKFDCQAGGSLDGAVVLLHCYFMDAASGGLEPPA